MLRLCTRSFSTSTRICSHIGSTPIPLPVKTSFHKSESQLTITGPLGSTTLAIPPYVKLAFPSESSDGSTFTFITPDSHKVPPKLSVSVLDATEREQRRTWGLTRTLIANAIQGQTQGFVKPIHLIGVGFRAAIEPDAFAEKRGKTGALRLNMKLGYSHPIYVPIPDGIQVEVPIPTRIVLRGNDKQKLGQFAADIREWRKPEPYKGKGIFVGNETIRMKSGKKK